MLGKPRSGRRWRRLSPYYNGAECTKLGRFLMGDQPCRSHSSPVSCCCRAEFFRILIGIGFSPLRQTKTACTLTGATIKRGHTLSACRPLSLLFSAYVTCGMQAGVRGISPADTLLDSPAGRRFATFLK